MAVTTNSDRLNRHRRLALELLFVERNHFCAVCVSNGHCELQALAQSLGVTHVRFPYNSPRLPVDVSHPRFVLDHNRCILCSRCVRVCDEIEGAHVWDIGARGIGSRLVAELDRPWGELRACTSCGKCVQVCPTGALVEKGQAVEEMTRNNVADHPIGDQEGGRPMKKARLATLWLDGCSGCHMSLLDIDEAIVSVARRRTSFTGRWSTPRSFPRTSTSPSSRAQSAARTTSKRSARCAATAAFSWRWATAP